MNKLSKLITVAMASSLFLITGCSDEKSSSSSDSIETSTEAPVAERKSVYSKELIEYLINHGEGDISDVKISYKYKSTMYEIGETYQKQAYSIQAEMFIPKTITVTQPTEKYIYSFSAKVGEAGFCLRGGFGKHNKNTGRKTTINDENNCNGTYYEPNSIISEVDKYITLEEKHLKTLAIRDANIEYYKKQALKKANR